MTVNGLGKRELLPMFLTYINTTPFPTSGRSEVPQVLGFPPRDRLPLRPHLSDPSLACPFSACITYAHRHPPLSFPPPSFRCAMGVRRQHPSPGIFLLHGAGGRCFFFTLGQTNMPRFGASGIFLWVLRRSAESKFTIHFPTSWPSWSSQFFFRSLDSGSAFLAPFFFFLRSSTVWR